MRSVFDLIFFGVDIVRFEAAAIVFLSFVSGTRPFYHLRSPFFDLFVESQDHEGAVFRNLLGECQ